MKLKDFQIDAICRLNKAMEAPERDIVLKSCTGSGKTIILTHFMDEYFKVSEKAVFVWLTPGKGELEIQSKEKMDRYVIGSSTKLLADIMANGFSYGDACFINWEKLTKRGNNALKDGERTNFIEWVERALDDGLHFLMIVDESHQNDTVKAGEIIELFKTKKIIRSSATPKILHNSLLIEVFEENVIAEGLIKKTLIINEDFPQSISVDDQVVYLLERAIEKQRELRAALLQRGNSVNPAIIIQLPNKSDLLLDQVERYFEKIGITYENNQLAVWLADKKINLDGIETHNAEPVAIIIKQAIATGWDCPRAYILVKLRDNMNETFEIQTIGRIRRMPEAKHYENALLDSCYLYTFDEKFTEGVKKSIGKSALDAVRLSLKPEFHQVSLTSEKKTDIPLPRDAKRILQIIATHFKKKYHLSSLAENSVRLEAYSYCFSSEIIDTTKSGSVSLLSRNVFDELNKIMVHEKLDTHKHGREYHHCVAEIGSKIMLPYSSINTIIQRLFSEKSQFTDKILSLSIRSLYAFVINNKRLLAMDLAESMSDSSISQHNKTKTIIETTFFLPNETVVTYDSYQKSHVVFHKCVYRGYLSSAEPRSMPEKLFERYCEHEDNIAWFYKNGDSGWEFFSVVFEDNFGNQKLFYPDYLLGTKDGRIWVIETKGGFKTSGESEDIDILSSLKFDALKKYSERYHISCGFVRQDKASTELLIATENYSDDFSSDDWQIISNIL